MANTKSDLPNWDDVRAELSRLETITEKLDYLEEIKQSVTDPLAKEKDELWRLKFVKKEISKEQNKRYEELKKCLSPDGKGSSFDFNIPISIIDELSNQYRTNPEFSFWFIKFRARGLFKAKIEDPKFQENISSPLALSHIKKDLKRLAEFKDRAIKLLEDGAVNLHKGAQIREHYNETEFLRLAGEYYENHVHHDFFAFGTDVQMLYCDHWLLKQYLEDRKSELEEKKQKETTTEVAKSLAKEISLEYYFEKVSRYKYVIELLVKEGYCEANTYVWIDKKRSNKSFIVGLIKGLQAKKYYKDNSSPTNLEIKEIAKNLFGVNIGIDTIKRSTPNFNGLNFIPIATTLD